MNIIIDGYNLMYRVNTKGKSLEEKREELISLLLEFADINSAKVTLVFDGRNQESAHRGHEKRAGMKIMFSARGETADEVIMELISKRTARARTYLVITSDNHIRQFAHKNHVKTQASEDFISYLE